MAESLEAAWLRRFYRFYLKKSQHECALFLFPLKIHEKIALQCFDVEHILIVFEYLRKNCRFKIFLLIKTLVSLKQNIFLTKPTILFLYSSTVVELGMQIVNCLNWLMQSIVMESK